ncbi:hypothetical protein HWV62_2167 [Athelia sp. TMB]|nr:hypothetical protein HWV62_2167 [Athelia sp. TMB]
MFVQALVVGAALVLAYKLLSEVLRRVRTPLNDLAGPKPSHWFLGNFPEIADSNHAVISNWTARWGSTFSFYSVFQNKSLCTVDHKAVNHILSHSNTYQKPSIQRERLALVLGKAFGPTQLKELTEVFNDKAIQLRDVWSALIAENKTARIEAVGWLGKATLDIIGQAGFGYDFSSLDATKGANELSTAFANLFKNSNSRGLGVLRFFIPFLQYLPSAQQRRVKASQETMSRVGNKLLADAKAALARGNNGKDGEQGRDLLSLLVHANTADDIPVSQRLSDKDVLAQVPTFLVAGHETTSTATAWALYCLTQAPAVQRKLREELLRVSSDTPSMDELNGLHYLDQVVREVLRLYAPVPMLMREAVADDVVPLAAPIVDVRGRARSSVRINKGDQVLISVRTINISTATWGPDALEFKPERWDAVPAEAQHVPGVWAHQMTFSAGPRACIGYKFSLVETKALLFALVRAFEFELAVAGADIRGSASSVVQRPFVVSEPEKGVQMPLIVRPYMA